MTTATLRELGIKTTAAQPDTPAVSAEIQTWIKTLETALREEKDFRKEGDRIVEIYEGKTKEATPFNILFSNTETLLPALYNSTPTPVVQRRFKDADMLGAAASKAAERTLKYLIDNGSSGYASFDDLMKSAVLEALLPGRGITRFKYDATIEEGGAAPSEESEAASGEVGEAAAAESAETPGQVEYETVCGEEVPWDRFLHGNAKKWQDVPWVAFEHFMTREELAKNFGDLGKQVPVIEMTKENADSGTTNRDAGTPSATGTAGLKVAQVYEIWDKIEKKVIFLCPAWPSEFLKNVPDPLQLTGFFPCPRPLQFVLKVSTLVPVPLYRLYEEQAKELNRITTRISKLTAALKVRGFYDSTVDGLEKVLAAGDNTLIPAENVAALLGQGNSLDKAIFLLPIEKLINVLQQLYVQREQVKTIIYELTGIADIMRGSSAASETLGAQKLKNQWGTLRLKKTQKEVMRYARECLRIIAEIAVSNLSPETLRAMTGLPFPMEEEKMQAQQAAQQQQQQQQQQAMLAQQQGQEAPPPSPPPPQLLELLASPTWQDILGVLNDDMQRNYRIDIETNSTVDAEATEDKEDISELLTAISQFLNGVAPLVQDGTMPFEVAQGMLLAVVRRFRFGPELEELLKKMKTPEQGKPSPEMLKMQEEIQKAGEQLKQDQATAQQQQQAAALSMSQEKAQLDLARKQFEMEKAFASKELAMQKDFAMRELDMAKNFEAQKADAREKQAQHELAMATNLEDQKLSQKSAMQDQKHAFRTSELSRKAATSKVDK